MNGPAFLGKPDSQSSSQRVHPLETYLAAIDARLKTVGESILQPRRTEGGFRGPELVNYVIQAQKKLNIQTEFTLLSKQPVDIPPFVSNQARPETAGTKRSINSLIIQALHDLANPPETLEQTIKRFCTALSLRHPKGKSIPACAQSLIITAGEPLQTKEIESLLRLEPTMGSLLLQAKLNGLLIQINATVTALGLEGPCPQTDAYQLVQASLRLYQGSSNERSKKIRIHQREFRVMLGKSGLTDSPFVSIREILRDVVPLEGAQKRYYRSWDFNEIEKLAFLKNKGPGSFKNEVLIHLALLAAKVPNIVEMRMAGDGYIILEHFDTDLREYQTALAGQETDEAKLLRRENFRTIGTVLAETLKQMHALGYLHRDIKAENILIKAEKDRITELKLADFGTTKHETEIAPDGKECIAGTLEALAPECAFHHQWTTASDIFAFGCLLFELLYNRDLQSTPLWAQKPLGKRRMDVFYCDRAEIEIKDIDQFDELLLCMLNPDPKMRPSAAQVLAELAELG